MREVFEGLMRRATAEPARTAVADDLGVVPYGDLAVRIAALAAILGNNERAPAGPVAILGQPGASWIVADLAATLAGRRVVPIPGFFSPDQVRHVLADAGVRLALHCDLPGRVGGTGLTHGLPSLTVDAHGPHADAVALGGYRGGAERVIYTSGTTGAPKGVLHGDRQLGHTVGAIARAVSASGDDRHLSALPPSLLLEQIAGVFVPLSLGARVHVSAGAIGAALTGDTRPLQHAFARVQPTTTVLVPQLLAALTAAAQAGNWLPPSSLRFAAVGGAPVPLSLVRAARAAGIRVIRGYGLSECGSVVAVERPDGPWLEIEGSCGPPLEGIHVSVAAGELVVNGPTVMSGYLNRSGFEAGRWPTGDAGAIGPGGCVVVHGRRDRILVLPSGRNVQADWVESTLTADPRVRAAVLRIGVDGLLEMDCHLQPGAASVDGGLLPDALRRELEARLEGLPVYARPARLHLKSMDRVVAPVTADSRELRAGV